MNVSRFFISVVVAATIIGCEETPETTVQDSINEAGFFAKFSPSDGVIPFPNNLLFQDTADGTLNIPIPPVDTTCSNEGERTIKSTLNDLDGFSTTAPITTSFSSAIDVNSLAGNVRVFTATLGGQGEVTAITGELAATDFALSVSSVDNETANVNPDCNVEDIGANKLVISPLKPLAPKTTYLVALTNSIKGPLGNNATADAVYGFAKSASPLVSVFPPTSLAEVNYGGLTGQVDLNNDGIVDVDVNEDGTIDAADTVAALTSFASLEGLRQLTSASEGWIEAYTVTIDNAGADTIADLAASDIVLSWTFTTQSVGDVLTAIEAGVDGGAIPFSLLADTMTDTPLGAADIYAGVLSTTYYLNIPTSLTDATDPASPTAGSWRGAGDTPVTQLNTTVVPTNANLNIPLIASIPKTAKPGTGWPVVIFQHGITGNRTNMLGLADTMAGAGYAVVAIDMPLHGLTGCEVSDVRLLKTTYERTFDVNFKNNADPTQVSADPDNCPTATVTDDIDPSGLHFINLESLLTSRDNVRQAVADLFVLKKALEGMDYDTSGADFDLNKVHFVGHSLGAIVGSVFLAVDNNSATPVKASVLGMPGGGIAKLLDGSATFGPVVQLGLAAKEVNKGFAQYESFLASAQMVLDSGDPVNYAAATVTGRDVLLFEVVGDGVDNLPDQVIPNNVLTVAGTVSAPLSGTDPLVSLMSLTQADTSTTYVANTDTVVKLSAGHHSSLLTPDLADGTPYNPADDPATIEFDTYAEIQAEMATFIATDGVMLPVTDATVISAAP